ncbi:MAG: hypothetical protein JSS11_05040 [Verrucomicrobia bacterium]|nr:hypothetical protein [Verrucomicrobiota bacterium]
MFLRRPSQAARRLIAACAALWVVALVTCTLHCTLGDLFASNDAKVAAHSCCQQSSAAKSAPASTAASDCHTFRDLASADQASPRADFVPHIFAFLLPLSLESMLSAPERTVAPLPPEPSLGPPPQYSRLLFSGQAPPAAA